MQYGVLEENITEYLVHVPEAQELPVWAELEPGSVIHTLKSFWEERQKDKTPKEIEQFMAGALTKALRRDIHISQYRLLFGDIEKGTPAKMVMPRDIAKAYFRILFENWPSERGEANDNGIAIPELPFLKESGLKANDLAKQLRNLVYASGYPVYCRPVSGIGRRGIFYGCASKGSSLIITSRSVPLKIESDPVIGIADWIEEKQLFLSHALIEDQIYICAIQNPSLSNDVKTLRDIHNICSIRTSLLALKKLCLHQKLPFAWDAIANRFIFAIYDNVDGKERDMGSDYISPDKIFMSEIPEPWLKDKKNHDFYNQSPHCAIGVHEKRGLEYYTYTHNILHDNSPPFILQNNPGGEMDKAYKNLFLACHAYGGFRQDCLSKDILRQAQARHWHFMTADEYIQWDTI